MYQKRSFQNDSSPCKNLQIFSNSSIDLGNYFSQMHLEKNCFWIRSSDKNSMLDEREKKHLEKTRKKVWKLISLTSHPQRASSNATRALRINRHANLLIIFTSIEYQYFFNYWNLLSNIFWKLFNHRDWFIINEIGFKIGY